MKWILVFSLLILACCADQTTETVSDKSPNQNSPVNQLLNNSNAAAIPEPDNSVRFLELEIRNKQFETVPNNFKNIDFKNFTYPTNFPKKSVTLKNDEFKYQTDIKDGGLSAGSASLHKVYFVDLTGDNLTEAVIFLH